MKTIQCAVCKRIFESENKNIKYCSLKCREIGRTTRQSVWMNEQRNYMRDYMREYRKRQKADITK